MDRQSVRSPLALIIVTALITSVCTAGALYAFEQYGSLAFAPSAIEAPGIPNTGGESIPQVVARTNPSVVSIIVSQNIAALEEQFGHYFWYGALERGEEDIEVGGGSGFVINDGYIVTNKHVVSLPNADYTVLTNDGKKHSAEVVYRDPSNDIAVLHIDEEYPALAIGDSSKIQIGQPVIAIGNALSEFQNTVSVGVISGLDRTIRAIDPVEGTIERLDEVIQTDAAINRGNSGGPLLDSAGRVIGINVAVSAEGQNIGFAIPANELTNVIAHLK